METITITTDVLGGIIFFIILFALAFFTLLYKYFNLGVEYARTREGWYHTRQKVDELDKTIKKQAEMISKTQQARQLSGTENLNNKSKKGAYIVYAEDSYSGIYIRTSISTTYTI